MYSGLSKIGGLTHDPTLPDIIQVDYKPMEINPAMNPIELQDSVVA